MRKQKLALILICFSAVMLVGTNSFAKGFYLNAAIGQSNVDSIAGIGFDSGTSFSLGAGYSLNKNFSVEGNYIDFGEMEDDILSIVKLSGSALEFLLVGRYNIAEKFGVYAKAGLFSWDVKAEAAGFGSASDDGTDLTFGVGAMVDFTENLSTFLQFQRYSFESDGEDIDLDNVSAGIQVHF